MGRFGRILLALVLILVGGFFLFAAIKAIVTKPGTEAQLKNAPFITDGKVNPANEGKTVIVLVDFNKIGGAADDLFGFTFQSPLVRRQVEVYKYESSYRFAWRRVEDGETAVDSAIFLGTPDALEYEIDPALLKSVSAGKNITEADFDQDQLKEFFAYYDGLHSEVYTGVYYITDTNAAFFGDYDGKEDYSENNLYYTQHEEVEGGLRVHYTCYDTRDADTVAFIGRQVGNRLIKDDRVDSGLSYEGVHTQEELLKSYNKNLSLGLLIGGTLLALLPLGIGLFLLVFIFKYS